MDSRSNLYRLVVLLAILSYARVSEAATLRMSASEAWGLTWDMDGNQAEPSPQTLLAIGVGEGIGDGWVAFVDLMTVVPRATFHPTFRVVPGVVKRWGGEKPEAGDFCLGFSLMWQGNPGYGATAFSQTIGVTGGPGVFVTKEIVASFAFGYRLGLDSGWSPKANILAFGPTITYLLPL